MASERDSTMADLVRDITKIVPDDNHVVAVGASMTAAALVAVSFGHDDEDARRIFNDALREVRHADDAAGGGKVVQ